MVKDYNPVPGVESFRASAFEWDRLVPDKRGIADKDKLTHDPLRNPSSSHLLNARQLGRWWPKAASPTLVR